MLTQNLINLIESGQAQFKNWATGGTGACRIPVPKNNYIVITDFHYHHFSDRNVVDLENVPLQEQMLRNSMHGLSFRSYGLDYYYAIRSAMFTQAYGGSILQDFIQQPFQTDSVYDCYQVHKTDCHITIWKIPSIWTGGTFGKLNDLTTEETSPVGYGTVGYPPSLNCQSAIDFQGGDIYLPFGNEQIPNPPLGFREVFRPDVTTNTGLPPTITDYHDCNFTYPLINISYVLVNQPFDKNTR